MSMVHCFITSEDEPGTNPKMLIVHDDKVEDRWTLRVKQKGVVIEVVNWVSQKLEVAGYRGEHIAMTLGQAESVMPSTRSIMSRRDGVTTPLASNVLVSKSNPHIESVVRTSMGAVRKSEAGVR